jgi:MFS superfamily sulfate permease-like transporter
MSVARLGFLADLISQPVLTGFLAGVGVSLIIGKLPGMLGIEASGSTFDKLVDTFQGLGDVNATSAWLSAGVVILILGLERVAPKVPAALAGVVVFSVVAALVDASSKAVTMVGDVPAGLPTPALPSFVWSDVAPLVPVAAAIAIVILAQSAAVARSFATKYGYRDDTNQDLLALSAANAGSAVTGGFAINGSPPRTAAGDAAGSRSQVVNLVMAAVIALILLFATGLFAYLPSPVLDAVVFAIGVGLVKVGKLREVQRARPVEFWVALVVLVVVAFVGVKEGILLGVLVSLVDRLRRQYAPPDEVLAENGTLEPRLAARVPDVAAAPGLLVYRFGTSLFFENAAHFDARVRDLVAGASEPVRAVVLDLAAMEDIDFTGAEVVRRLAHDLGSAGVHVYVTEMSDETAQALDASGMAGVVTAVPRMEEAVRIAAAAPATPS